MKNISVAIIPARGGSKGIPKKNLRKINGETLVFKALNFALKTRLFDYVFCSTDDIDIAHEAKKFGNTFIDFRPKSLSGDFISDAELLKYEINNIEAHLNLTIHDVCLLQPTSPIRNVKDISLGKKLINKNETEAVWSVSEVSLKYHPFKILKKENDYISLFDKKGKDIIARQQLEKTYVRNGVFYFFKREIPFKYNSLLGEKTEMVLINDPVINIDDLTDLKRAQDYFKNIERSNNVR